MKAALSGGPSTSAAPAAKAGQQVTIVGNSSLTVTFSHPGKYPFHCQYHASAGMACVFLVS